MKINLGIETSEFVSTDIEKDELTALIEQYSRAKEIGDDTTMNELIDIGLRCYLQGIVEGHIVKDAEACGVLEPQIEKYKEEIKRIENLVYNDSNWEIFSNKIKTKGIDTLLLN